MPKDDREPFRGRFPADLKQQIVNYARERQISANAAAIALIRAGLRAERRRHTPPPA